MDKELNYEKDINIDETSLDVEWLEQSSLTAKYARIQADAEREYEKAKERLEVLKAELDLEIRANPKEYINEEITKTTEAVISNAIIQQKSYREASDEVIEKKHEFNIAKGAVKSIDSKKTALENLVKLHGQQYFAGPSVPRDLSKEWENKQKQEQSNKKVRIRK